jgi:hypothetical protein
MIVTVRREKCALCQINAVPTRSDLTPDDVWTVVPAATPPPEKGIAVPWVDD